MLAHPFQKVLELLIKNMDSLPFGRCNSRINVCSKRTQETREVVCNGFFAHQGSYIMIKRHLMQYAETSDQRTPVITIIASQ